MVSSGAVGSCTVYNLDTSRASFSSVGEDLAPGCCLIDVCTWLMAAQPFLDMLSALL